MQQGKLGTTFNIQRFSTEDGPGIRTTVFFKGCLLRCAWCHNPEGLSPHPELVWYDIRCIGSRRCPSACPAGALRLTGEGIQIERASCDACGACTKACPAGALEIIGRRWTAEQLLDEILKDSVFYETSGGGVTFSGGEPMQQSGFLLSLLRLCRREKLHTALDTCGAASWEHFERVLALVDLVLLDLKLYDSSQHRDSTGAQNGLILDNARRISALGLPIWIRTPIIPGYTADAGNIAALGQFIAQALPTVERWDLLAYTNLGQPKYHRLDRPYALESTPLMTRDAMENLHSVAQRHISAARWSGATR